MARSLSPKKEIKTAIETGHVHTVRFETGGYGLAFIHKNGARTYCTLSEEATKAVASSFNALIAGGGEEIKKEWRVVPQSEILNRIVREEVTIPLWLAERLEEFLNAKASFPPKETLIPIGDINAFSAAIAKVKEPFL